MAKLKVDPSKLEVVKKTLSVSAPTGKVMEATQDSTAFLRERQGSLLKRMSQIESEYARLYPKESFTTDDEYKMILKKLAETGMDLERQKNKGKEGFDKFGKPVKKMADVKSKITGNK